MMSTRKLLALIRRVETGTTGPESYDTLNAHMEAIVGKYPLTQMPVMQVIALQEKARSTGSKSSAAGAYQILYSTLRWLMDEMKLRGTELYDQDLQERMAYKLLLRRGMDEFRRGLISRTEFANNLAKEWAGLPVVTAIVGDKGKLLQPGESYYKGDGLNKVLTTPATLLAAVDELVLFPGAEVRPAPPAPAPVPVPQAEKESGSMFWQALFPIILGQVRHMLTAFGGFLVASGWASESDATAIAGGLAAVIGVLWSALQKIR